MTIANEHHPPGLGTPVLSEECEGPRPDESPPSGRFTLWQLPSQKPGGQMMSYVLQTRGGKTLVIDGGDARDASYLKGFLAAVGNHVHAWFITHPHRDHVDALTAILGPPEDPRADRTGLRIDAIHASLPDEAWVAAHEPQNHERLRTFKKTVEESGLQITELALGQLIHIDGVRIEILGVRNPDVTAGINNSSVVMRVTDAHKSVLFTSDLMAQGGRKLLRGPYRDRLRADYVQMSHHGQDGVDEAFYRAVAPKACLWPSPRWLYDNDGGSGKGSGRWQTLEVRAWMERLNVREHYVSGDGPCRID